MDKPLYILGIDLGQAQDYTAITVLERETRDAGGTRIVDDRTGSYHRGGVHMYNLPSPRAVPTTEKLYAARHLERLPIGTPYPAQVARVKELHDRLKADTGAAPLVVVDQTGVGRPVVDMLRAVRLEPVAVTITGATP